MVILMRSGPMPKRNNAQPFAASVGRLFLNFSSGLSFINCRDTCCIRLARPAAARDNAYRDLEHRSGSAPRPETARRHRMPQCPGQRNNPPRQKQAHTFLRSTLRLQAAVRPGGRRYWSWSYVSALWFRLLLSAIAPASCPRPDVRKKYPAHASSSIRPSRCNSLLFARCRPGVRLCQIGLCHREALEAVRRPRFRVYASFRAGDFFDDRFPRAVV